MSKKYSASKFRLSLASNSPRPTELPLENGPLCLRFASRHSQGTGGTLAREASCGKNRSRNASHHSFAIFPSIFCSLLPTQPWVSFCQECWECLRKGVLALNQVWDQVPRRAELHRLSLPLGPCTQTAARSPRPGHWHF